MHLIQTKNSLTVQKNLSRKLYVEVASKNIFFYHHPTTQELSSQCLQFPSILKQVRLLHNVISINHASIYSRSLEMSSNFWVPKGLNVFIRNHVFKITTMKKVHFEIWFAKSVYFITFSSFMHPTHHIEPPPIYLAIDEVLLDVKYSTKSTIEHATKCYVIERWKNF